jgi:leader peptidase (prepilin peptidase)/N-methyltransferase
MLATLLVVISPFVGWALGRLGRALTGVDAPSLWLAAGAVLVTGFCLVAASQPLALSLGLGWCLLLLAAIDIKVMRLPDGLTLPLAAAGLGLALWRGEPALDHGTAMVAGFLAFAGLDRLYVRLRGRSGLGLGDAKLFGAAGAWLGWRPLPAVLLLACAMGLAWFAILVMIDGLKGARRSIPFGPPLCLAMFVVWSVA